MDKLKFFLPSLRRACCAVKARIYDKLLGIETGGKFDSARLDESRFRDMRDYMPTPYGRIEKMIRYLKPADEDIFVDFGCGKGRVVFLVALKKLKKTIGIEINSHLIGAARRNLAGCRWRRSPVELINTDAADYPIIDENIFFIFNPFGEKTLEKVIFNIKHSLESRPRKVRIIYYGAAHAQLLDAQNWLFREGYVENDACLVWSSK